MNLEERQAYEADLQAVLDYLDHPPAPGSGEDRDFAERMARVQELESQYTAEPEAPPPAMADQVRKRLDALRAASEPPERHGLTEGHGLGPTLGMDVSH
ncbi:hypothetical protein [Caulobacter sp. 17J80-11]|uniref:hypothetical protein n=1 Tax=Caulobacter sp. 17J80-11 TaxID=2763502 RepID=UPI0016534309|nr:hypothetical protein [Caulobacter sp. 17J80-11]MBC6981290.1 hypothetical protein [Caulobacter sp. 17J80-11]